MTASRIIGVVLILVGLLGLLMGGISWTREKTVIDIGPIEAKTQERESVAVPPIVGGIALVAGLALVFVPAIRRA